MTQNEIIDQLTEAKIGLIEAAKTGNKIMFAIYRKQIKRLTMEVKNVN